MKRLVWALLGLMACGTSPSKHPESQTSLALTLQEAYLGYAKVSGSQAVPLFWDPEGRVPLTLDARPVSLRSTDTVAVRQAVVEDALVDIGYAFAPRERLQEQKSCWRHFSGPFSYLNLGDLESTWLSVVAYAEGTGSCYDDMFSYKKFSSFVDHPNQCQSFGQSCSTAAGRYQMLYATWKRMQKLLNLDSFEPAAQDRAALALFAYRGFTTAARPLSLIEFRIALEQISWEWASLPPGRYGQGFHSEAELWQQYRLWSVRESAGARP